MAGIEIVDNDTELDTYRAIIKRIIQDYVDFLPAYADVKASAVFDDERGHYILYHTGWDGSRRIHSGVIHIDIINGKLWVQHDGTKNGIVDELIEAGIPQNRIVLGFHHPFKRKFTEFPVS